MRRYASVLAFLAMSLTLTMIISADPTCFRAGVQRADTGWEFNPWGYRHLLQYPNPRYKADVPQDNKGTLNAFGLAYEKDVRTSEALVRIAELDAHGDGPSNAAEIAKPSYPGEAGRQPGQPLAPTVILSEVDLRKLPPHTQFMLMNASKELTDEYAGYTGVRVADVLAAAGVDLVGADGITVFAPDGYSAECTIEEISRPFPLGRFYAGPAALKGTERSFVNYPETIPPGVKDGGEIPGERWLLLALEHDGKQLDVSFHEKETGRLVGEGPFRLIKPQRNLMGDPARPGRPDRSVKAKTYGDGWDYNPAIDHNAGACVRGACVIRVNPVPGGFKEYDWKNAWPLIKGRQIAVFGHGVKSKT